MRGPRKKRGWREARRGGRRWVFCILSPSDFGCARDGRMNCCLKRINCNGRRLRLPHRRAAPRGTVRARRGGARSRLALCTPGNIGAHLSVYARAQALGKGLQCGIYYGSPNSAQNSGLFPGPAHGRSERIMVCNVMSVESISYISRISYCMHTTITRAIGGSLVHYSARLLNLARACGRPAVAHWPAPIAHGWPAA